MSPTIPLYIYLPELNQPSRFFKHFVIGRNILVRLLDVRVIHQSLEAHNVHASTQLKAWVRPPCRSHTLRVGKATSPFIVFSQALP